MRGSRRRAQSSLGTMASLVELVEGVRHTNAEAAFTALRKLREAFEDERAPGK